MDNENIKEILEFDFQSQGERIEINEYERNILKDYITNLQEELERYKHYFKTSGIQELIEENEILKENAIHNDKVVDKAKWNEMLYKSRIEKAIEYIEKSMDNSQPFYKYLFGDENGKVENLDRLLNILQGVGKE